MSLSWLKLSNLSRHWPPIWFHIFFSKVCFSSWLPFFTPGVFLIRLAAVLCNRSHSYIDTQMWYSQLCISCYLLLCYLCMIINLLPFLVTVMIVITKYMCMHFSQSCRFGVYKFYIDECILPVQSPVFHDYFIREYLVSQ